jgi:hypothetical protein
VSETLEAALDYAARGWRVLAIGARTKVPLTAHGVDDATTDADVIAGWLERWGDINIAIACGAPGPSVLDIDHPEQAPAVDPDTPTVATARGRQHYFAGLDERTIKLPYGELRGVGSYVVCPPSIHPTGKLYVWTVGVDGPLPSVPGTIARGAARAGRGRYTPPAAALVEGEGRHDFLVDIAVRLVRGGIRDERMLAALLAAAFAEGCAPDPPPRRGEFAELARWAAGSAIATGEALALGDAGLRNVRRLP